MEGAVDGPSYHRLSAQDASFLHFERRSTPMHVAAVAVFEGGPLRREDGGLDTDRLDKHVESRLHLLPRYRHRLAFTPLAGHPIWVDDQRFDLHYHVRHVGVPAPGTDRALQEVVGQILSQHLDRKRPLWEMWVVDGLEADRFALVSKVHHCMVDGASGANLLTLLFSSSPDGLDPRAPSWRAIREPSPLRLLADDVARRARLPLEALQSLGGAVRDLPSAWASVTKAGAALGEAVETGLRAPARTRLNRPIGPHRRVGWRSMDLEQVKELKRALGGTVNDVVLAVVAGALHHFLEEREPWPARFDYRVVIPVNMRPPGDDFTEANHVSALFLSLPVSEPDPLQRYASIRAETRRLKQSRAAQGTDLLIRFADWSGSSGLTRLGARLVSRVRPYNLIVTNVPGPQFPLYVLGAPLLEMFPFLPLFDHQGLGVAALSYAGRVGWGLVGDWELTPDLGRLTAALDASFEELREAAEAH
jgi:WS/DGAT/MGAT family acyltransferase